MRSQSSSGTEMLIRLTAQNSCDCFKQLLPFFFRNIVLKWFNFKIGLSKLLSDFKIKGSTTLCPVNFKETLAYNTNNNTFVFSTFFILMHRHCKSLKCLRNVHAAVYHLRSSQSMLQKCSFGICSLYINLWQPTVSSNVYLQQVC